MSYQFTKQMSTISSSSRPTEKAQKGFFTDGANKHEFCIGCPSNTAHACALSIDVSSLIVFYNTSHITLSTPHSLRMSARCSICYTGVADDTTRHANVPHTHTHTLASNMPHARRSYILTLHVLLTSARSHNASLTVTQSNSTTAVFNMAAAERQLDKLQDTASGYGCNTRMREKQNICWNEIKRYQVCIYIPRLKIRLEQVTYRFWGVWDSLVFVPHGFRERKIIFTLYFLD